MTSMELCNQYAILSNPKPLFFFFFFFFFFFSYNILLLSGVFLLLGLFIPLVTCEILCCVMIYRDQYEKSLEVDTVFCNIFLFNCSI